MNFTDSANLTVNTNSEDFILTHFKIIFRHVHLSREINLPPVMGNKSQHLYL